MNRFFLFCGFALLLVGCLEQKTDLLLLQGGQGKLEIRTTFGAKLSESLLKDAKTQEGLVDASRNALAGGWQGLEFWNGESASAFDGKVSYRGTTWFRDITKLNLTGEPCRWKRKNPASGFEFQLCFDPLPTPPEGQTRLQQIGNLKDSLKDYLWELKAEMPGAATIVSGPGVAEARIVTFTLTGLDLIAGAALPEADRVTRDHRLIVAVSPAGVSGEQAKFEAEWKEAEKSATPKERVQSKRQPTGPVPVPPPLTPPLALSDFTDFFPVPSGDPEWRLEKPMEDAISQTWSGSIRGTRHERIPITIRVPKMGRPCPVMIKQESWHGTKEDGQLTSGPVLQAGIAVVSFDSPFVGSRKREGYDPLGNTPEERLDNQRWAVSDLRAVIQAVPSAPLPAHSVVTKKGMALVGVSLGGPRAAMAFALEPDIAVCATIVAGAGAYTAARDNEPAGASIDGGGDLRLRVKPEELRASALVDPAMALPLSAPRPLVIAGGEEDGLAPGSSLRRLARAVPAWPDVLVRVYPGLGHGLKPEQQEEVTKWIIERTLRLK